MLIEQCGLDMTAQIKSHTRQKEINHTKDAKGLIDIIKSHCYYSNSNRHPYILALDARIKLYNYRQHKDQSVQDYIKELNALHDVVKAVDGG